MQNLTDLLSAILLIVPLPLTLILVLWVGLKWVTPKDRGEVVQMEEFKRKQK